MFSICQCPKNYLKRNHYLPYSHWNPPNDKKSTTRPNGKIQACTNDVQIIQAMHARKWIHTPKLSSKSKPKTTIPHFYKNTELQCRKQHPAQPHAQPQQHYPKVYDRWQLLNIQTQMQRNVFENLTSKTRMTTFNIYEQ